MKQKRLSSVDEAPAFLRAAVAGDACGFVGLERELVVVAQLFAHLDVALGVDNDLLAPFHGDDASGAAGVAAVIDEPCQATLKGRVDHRILCGRARACNTSVRFVMDIDVDLINAETYKV